jgi:hypothetical protein
MNTTTLSVSQMREAMDLKQKIDLRNKLCQSILGVIDGFIKELIEMIVDYILAPPPLISINHFNYILLRHGLDAFIDRSRSGFDIVYVPLHPPPPTRITYTAGTAIEEGKKKKRYNKKLLYNH